MHFDTIPKLEHLLLFTEGLGRRCIWEIRIVFEEEPRYVPW